MERGGENRESENAQLAREIEIALPQELTREQGISLVREYVKAQFVAAGMCADFAIHDTGGNPHAHIMLTMRPIEQGGAWGAKQKYLALKEEVKEAEQIRKRVYSILRQEQREQQPRRAQDMEH